MLRGSDQPENPTTVLDGREAPRLLLSGSATGLPSGFFGIGGAFLEARMFHQPLV
ncbi:MAG: hypothetical protein AMXMBFR59_21700 [Rhodanobacteraceae bacterium]